MLYIKNIHILHQRSIQDWIVSAIVTDEEYYLIKVLRNAKHFDMRNLKIDRYSEANGYHYRIYCPETGTLAFMPLEVVRDMDGFITYLINELI